MRSGLAAPLQNLQHMLGRRVLAIDHPWAGWKWGCTEHSIVSKTSLVGSVASATIIPTCKILWLKILHDISLAQPSEVSLIYLKPAAYFQ
jgi:hypothetical protein